MTKEQIKNAQVSAVETVEEVNKVEFEHAPEIKAFLDGDYFEGLCEIAAACKTKTPLFIPEKTLGIFNSLYFKRTFGRKENTDGSWLIGDFVTRNRFLYVYDRQLGKYTSKRDANITAFAKRVNELIANKDYKVFSLTPVTKADELDELLN